MKQVSFDIETLASGPDAALVAMGAVEFDEDNVYVDEAYYATVKAADAARFGVIDGNNVQWWMQQGAEARKEIYMAGGKLRDALVGLLNWTQLRPARQKVWACPATFDLMVLEHACRAVKLPLPWHYKQWMDGRTLYELTKMEGPQPLVHNPHPHHALHDAIEQARLIQNGLYGFAKRRKIALD